jgi:mono/diheme cytochrome c family protein
MFYLVVVLALVSVAADARHVVAAQQPATPTATPSLDVAQLFATTCGWCHSDGGRAPGKGPQLMNTERSDDFIRTRIKTGKEGAMPAFGSTFSDADINAIIKYIRALKPEPG